MIDEKLKGKKMYIAKSKMVTYVILKNKLTLFSVTNILKLFFTRRTEMK